MNQKIFTGANLIANDDTQLIYKGKRAALIQLHRLVSLVSPLVGVAAIINGIKHGTAFEGCWIGLISLAVPFYLHFLYKRQICDVTYNRKTDEYVATTISTLIFKIKTKFKLKDITYSESYFTSIYVGSKMFSLFVDPEYFIDKQHYERLMSRKLSLNFQSIYIGKHMSEIRRGKLYFLMISAIGLCAQPSLLQKGMEIGGTEFAMQLCLIVGISMLITPFVMHYFTENYVTDITYSIETDEYIASTMSFFLQKRQIKFKIKEIQIPKRDTMHTSFFVGLKKIPLYINPFGFHDVLHYSRIMGHNNHTDLKILNKELNKI